jgi:hypothetical protein
VPQTRGTSAAVRPSYASPPPTPSPLCSSSSASTVQTTLFHRLHSCRQHSHNCAHEPGPLPFQVPCLSAHLPLPHGPPQSAPLSPYPPIVNASRTRTQHSAACSLPTFDSSLPFPPSRAPPHQSSSTHPSCHGTLLQYWAVAAATVAHRSMTIVDKFAAKYYSLRFFLFVTG